MSDFFSWAIKILPNSDSIYSYYQNYSIESLKNWFKEIDKKVKTIEGFDELKYKFFDIKFYTDYFSLIESIGLQEDFKIETTIDKVVLKGTLIKSLFSESENRKKVVVFCHGVSNNRWSLFYCIHIALQMGYNVVTYDARNHGSSGKSYTTLGKVESEDLEDIVCWSLKKLKPSSLGIYGFSMGASTILHWIGKFQNKHPEVKAVTCEAPFDSFEKRFSSFLKAESLNESEMEKQVLNSSSENRDKSLSYISKLKTFFIYNFAMKIMKSPFSLYNVKPVESIPEDLKVNLLLIHGLNDKVIDFEASVEIWKKITENKNNKKKVNFFIVEDAGHGDVVVFADFFTNKVFKFPRDKNDNIKNLSFSSIVFYFFNNNL